MKNKFYLALLLITIFITILTLPIKAQEATDSANDIEIKEKLKERLEKALSQNPQTQEKWQAIFGKVTNAYEDSITIEQDNFQKATVNLNQDTDLSFYKTGSATKNITPKDIQTDWFAIAMGTNTNEDGTLLAKRISFSITENIEDERVLVFGKVKEIDENSLTLINGEEKIITIPSSTKYIFVIDGVKNPEIDDIDVNDKAVAVVVKSYDTKDNLVLTLKSMYVSPSISSPNAVDNQVTEATASSEASKSGEKN